MLDLRGHEEGYSPHRSGQNQPCGERWCDSFPETVSNDHSLPLADHSQKQILSPQDRFAEEFGWAMKPHLFPAVPVAAEK